MTLYCGVSQNGVMLLERSRGGAVAASRLISPELVFSDGAAIELTYWLWHSGAHKEVTFLLYRSAVLDESEAEGKAGQVR